MSTLSEIHNHRKMADLGKRLLATENALKILGLCSCNTCGQWCSRDHRIALHGNVWCLDCLEHNESAIEEMPLDRATPFQLWEFMEPLRRESRMLFHGENYRNQATGQPRIGMMESRANDMMENIRRGKPTSSTALDPFRRKSDLYLTFLWILRDLGREDELGQHPNPNFSRVFRFDLLGMRFDSELGTYLDKELEQAWREVRRRIIEEPCMEAFRAGKQLDATPSAASASPSEPATQHHP